MEPRPPRYAPALPLPREPWRPGHGAPRPALPIAAPGGTAGRVWRDPAHLDDPGRLAFRFGVDLFNAGCWWEAHEAWEGLWARTVRGCALFHLLQGLILLAAGQVQARAGRARGALRLTGRALQRLHAAQRHGAGALPLGLPLAQTLAALEAWRHGEGDPEGPLASERPPWLWLHEPPPPRT
jgi:Domain of unknown function (DUF309)